MWKWPKHEDIVDHPLERATRTWQVPLAHTSWKERVVMKLDPLSKVVGRGRLSSHFQNYKNV